MMDISDNVVIYKGCKFRAPYKIHIGANSIIGEDCELDGREGIFIGENVNLSSYVRIWTGQHSVNSPDFSIVGGVPAKIIGTRNRDLFYSFTGAHEWFL